MKVVVRVRPQNREKEQRKIVKVLDENILIFDPKEDEEDFFYQGIKQACRNYLKKSNKDLQFMFDCVFDENSSNRHVHENTTKLILDGLLEGYNCSVFAYGATGAGKTHTMLGNVDEPGITFLTARELFDRIESVRSEKPIEIAVSYLEVYNENIKDLLSPSGILPIREDSRKGTFIPGLSIHKPKVAEELLEMLHLGNKSRTQHPTDANAESSRSHAVFTIYVKQHERIGSLSGGFRVAKMALIDLAGSERATVVSKGVSCRMREGSNINKSLLALGNCINALADRKAKAHIPYRDSKLTRILKDSLDGNCHTVMIAAVNVSANSYEDTYNTLKYADRAKNIKINLKQNVISMDIHVSQYPKIVQDLRKEIADLKKQLQEKPLPAVLPSVVACSVPPPPDVQAGNVNKQSLNSEEARKLQLKFSRLFEERCALNQQFLRMSGLVQETKLRMHQRQGCLERFSLISNDIETMDRSCTKSGAAMQRMTDRQEKCLERRFYIEKRLSENRADLNKAEEEVKSFGSEALETWLKMQHAEVDLKIKDGQLCHASRLATIEEQEHSRTNRLLGDALKVAKRQYLLLKAHGVATCDIVDDFEGLVKQAYGWKEVAWADQIPTGDSDGLLVDISDALNLSTSLLRTATIGDAKEAPVSAPNHTEPCNGIYTSEKINQVTVSPSSNKENIAAYSVEQTVREGGPRSSYKGTPVPSSCRSLFKSEAHESPDATNATFSLSPALSVVKRSAMPAACGKGSILSLKCNGNVSIGQKSLNEKKSFTCGSLHVASGQMLNFDSPGPSILMNPSENCSVFVPKKRIFTEVNCEMHVAQNGTPDAKKLKLNGADSRPNAITSKPLKERSPAGKLCDIKRLKKFGFPSMLDKSEKPQSGVVKGDKAKPPWTSSSMKIRAEQRSRMRSQSATNIKASVHR